MTSKKESMFKTGYAETIWGAKVDPNELWAYKMKNTVMLETLLTQSWRILEPDKKKRVDSISESCYEVQAGGQFPNTAERYAKLREEFEFPKEAGSVAQMAGLQGDRGDELGLMPGIVKVFTPDYVEKEIWDCPVGLVGNELCRGTCLCVQAFLDAGTKFEDAPKYVTQMTEAIGWGNSKCRLFIERAEYYNEELAVGDRSSGPRSRATTVSPADLERPVSRVLRDGELRCATGSEGSKFTIEQSFGVDQSFYFFWLERAMDKTLKDYKERARVLKPVFYGGGKAQFADPWAKKGLYQLLSIPEDVQDGRALISYLEYIALSRPWAYTIEEFGEDRACMNVNRDNMKFMAMINVLPENFENDFKEYLLCLESWLNGVAKTLLLPSWSVVVTDQPDDNIVKFEVVKKIDREQ